MNDGWVKYRDKKPHTGDELDGVVEYLWIASTDRGLSHRSLGIASNGPWMHLYGRALGPAEPDYWRTPTPSPKEDNAVEKATDELAHELELFAQGDPLAIVTNINALIDAKIAEAMGRKV